MRTVKRKKMRRTLTLRRPMTRSGILVWQRRQLGGGAERAQTARRPR